MYTDLARLTRGEQAYRQLKQLLLDGDVPMGERLAEERLAERFGLSRTPVREALMRLLQEGLVERLADDGYRPAIPDVPRIVDLYQVRFALEEYAMSAALEPRRALDATALEHLREEWQALEGDDSSSDFVLLDEDFHLRLAAATTRSDALVDSLRGINERIRVVRRHDFLTPGRVVATIEEHLSIVEAVLDGNDDMERLMRGHLRNSLRIAEERAVDALSRMARMSPDEGAADHGKTGGGETGRTADKGSET